MGGIAAFIDAEHALDPVYAKNLGVNVDELWVSQPDTGEQALEIVESLVRSGAMDFIVVDSVAALTPRAEIEGEMGDSHVGLQARLMSQALRKLTATLSKTKTCLVFINQIRMKIGVMFGNPETTTGGLALKFYSTIRLEVRRVESISHGQDDVVGNKIRVKVVKNKIAPPFRKAEMDLMFGKGISASGSLLDAAVQNSVVEKAGSWFSYGKERIGQGAENARTFLEANPAVMTEIEAKVRADPLPEARRGGGRPAGGSGSRRGARCRADPREAVAPAGRESRRRRRGERRVLGRRGSGSRSGPTSATAKPRSARRSACSAGSATACGSPRSTRPSPSTSSTSRASSTPPPAGRPGSPPARCSTPCTASNGRWGGTVRSNGGAARGPSTWTCCCTRGTSATIPS